MLTRLSILAFGLILLIGTSASSAELTPEAVIEKIYKSYGIGSNTDSTGLSDAGVNALFDEPLRELYNKAVKANAIGADFFVQGQDFSLIRPIEITNTATQGDQSTVSATLSQKDVDKKGKPIVRTNKFKFMLVKRQDGWRLKDASTGGESYVASLKSDLSLAQ